MSGSKHRFYFYLYVVLFAYYGTTVLDTQAQCTGISGSFIFESPNGAGHSVTTTQDGGYLLGGTSNILNQLSSDWLIIRTDANFNPVWSKALGFINTSESGTNFVARELPDGRIAAIGYQLQGGDRRGTILVLSAAGELLQSIMLPALNSTPRDVIGLSDGSIVVCGTISGNGGASDDAFVLKYSIAYNLLWYKRLNSSNGPNDHFYGVIIGSNGNIFLVGGTQVFNSTLSGYLVEMNQAGDIVNDRRYSSNSLIQFLTIREAPDGGFIVGAHMNIGSSSDGLIFRLNPDFTIAWNVSIRQGNRTFIPFVDFDDVGNVVANLSNEYQNGNHFIGIAKLNANDGSIISVINPTIDVNHESQIISHTAVRNSEGGFVSIGSRDGNVSVVAFDSCLDNECLESEDYVLPPLTVNVANVNLNEVNPTLPVPSNPTSQFVDIIMFPGNCASCADELTVNEIDFCAGISGVIQPYLNGIELTEAANILWAFSDGTMSIDLNPSLVFQNPGTVDYTLDITTVSGCAYSYSGTLEVLNLPPPPELPTVLQLCEGDTESVDFTVFTDFSILDPSGIPISNDYLFSTQGQFAFSFISPCTTYVVTIDVQWIEIPTLLPIFQNDYCTNENIQFSLLNWASIAGDAELSINPGNGLTLSVTDPFIETIYSQPGSYTITISGTISGCDVSQSAQINVVSPLQFNIQSEMSFCSGESVTLDFSDFGFPVQNDAGQVVQSFTTSVEGTYTFTAVNACGSFSQTVDVSEIIFAPLPFNSSSMICPVTDTLPIGFMNESYLFQWSTGASTSIIFISEAGNYNAVVSDLAGTCNAEYTFTINAFELNPTIIFPEPSITICEEGSRTITPPFVGVPYTFSDETIGYSFYVEESGALTASYSDLCYTYQEDLFVILEPCLCPVFVPNVFTPNADGINDIFKASADCPITSFRMTIFNRWGREIFESSDINFGWNGSSPNNDFYGSEGVYYYLIWYSQDLEGLNYPSELQGHVTLLR